MMSIGTGPARRNLAIFAAIALVIGVTTVDRENAWLPPAASDIPAAEAAPNSEASTPGLIEVGPTPPDREVWFELVLAFPGADAMRAYGAALTDPSSPDYRRFLTADDIGQRFGLSDDAMRQVLDWADGHGLTVTTNHPQRIAVGVRGPAGTVAALFGSDLRDFADADGRTFHAPLGPPTVPDELEGLVTAIGGLDARPSKRPASRLPIAAGPRLGMTPTVIDRAFELEPLRAIGLDGSGQTIAILSLDTFDPADVAAFDAKAGITGLPVEKVPVNGGVAEPGEGQVEVNLDIDIVRALAPKAQILDYEAQNREFAMAAIIDQIVADGRADVVTISWGSCEQRTSREELARMATSLAAAWDAGITVFVASGDYGAYDCRNHDWDDTRLSVDSPSGDVSVVAVGGTYLEMLEDGTYIDEAGWENPLSGYGTGGGLSTIYPRPDWQVGPGTDNGRSNGMRQIPDVAGPGDSTSGFMFVSEGRTGSGGGTSASSPFWAGYTILVRQLAEREGIDGLGTLGPTLYAVAATDADGALFHDVVRGGNLYDNAGPGWDYATGLGTPRAAPLARAIVDYVKR